MSSKILKIAGLVALGVGILATAGILSVPALGIGLTAGRLLTFGAVTTIGAFLGPRVPRVTGSSLAARLTIQTAQDAGRTVLLGRVATAGTLRFRAVLQQGTKNPDVLWIVLVLAGSPVDAIESATINGQPVTWDPVTGATTGAFAGKLWIYTRLGTEITDAFPQLAGESADWAAKPRKGRGLAAVAIKAIVDETFKGKLDPLFLVRGARLYDPRLDTTVGGSGAHRWDDPTTWTWSANAVLAKLGYLRGFEIQDHLGTWIPMMGLGLRTRPDLVDFANWMAEATIADEAVPVLGGGTIPRYQVQGILEPGRSHREHLMLLGTADAGEVIWSAGQYRSRTGVSRIPQGTAIRSADLIEVPQDVALTPAVRGRVTVIRGQFADAADGYRPKDYPSVIDATGLARWGERPSDLTLPYTVDHRAAQRLATIALRRQGSTTRATLRGTYRWLVWQPGDLLTVDLPEYLLPSRTMRVMAWEVTLEPDDQGRLRVVVTMQLLDESSALYLWDPATQEQSLTTPAPLPSAEALASVKQLPQGGPVAIDGGERSIATIQSGGTVLIAGTGQTDGAEKRGLLKGEQTGSCVDGVAVTFPLAYQNVPLHIEVQGGLTAQPQAGAWSPSFDAALPQIPERLALNPNATGFLPHMKLRQTGVLTTIRHAFAGTVLDVVDEADTITLTSAPANDSQYTVNSQATMTLRTNDLDPEAILTGTLVYAIETKAITTWNTRALVTVERSVQGGDGQVIFVVPQTTLFAEMGLDSADQLRLRFVSFGTVGPTVGTPTASVVGLTGTASNATAGVWYTTSGGDNVTTMTPVGVTGTYRAWQTS